MVKEALKCEAPAGIVAACGGSTAINEGIAFGELIEISRRDRDALNECVLRHKSLAEAVTVCNENIKNYNAESARLMPEIRSNKFSLRRPGTRSLVFLALCVVFAVAAPALSQTATVNSACENAGSTAAMRGCEIARLKRADEGMNAAYQSLSAKLDQRGREKLRAAQAAWLKFRVAEVNFQADAARGGTLAPLIAASVQADLTEARCAELEKAAWEFK